MDVLCPAVISFSTCQSCPCRILGALKVQIFVTGLTGKPVVVDVHLWETIRSLKAKLHPSEGIPPHWQRLIFAGKQLEDDRPLYTYNIDANSKIYLMLRVLGGTSKPPLHYMEKLRLANVSRLQTTPYHTISHNLITSHHHMKAHDIKSHHVK